MFARILCATDLSAASIPAIGLAAKYAERFAVPLTVAYVYEPVLIGAGPAPGPTFAGITPSPAELGRQANKNLEDLSIPVDAERVAIRHTSPPVAICELAEEREAGLIVVGTHGRGGIDRLLLGSVAEQVVRHAPCSVLVARGAPAAPPAHLMACTDFSPAAQPALELAASLSKAFEARVTILHAYTQRMWRQISERADAHTIQAIQDELRESLKVSHEDRFAPPVLTSLAVGDRIPDAITDAAAREDAELLVLGTHGRTGLSRLLMGSVAEQVTRHAHCSVLIARE